MSRQSDSSKSDFAPPSLSDFGLHEIDSTTWIAIEPPLRRGQVAHQASTLDSTQPPPSFRDSQFDVILRRQRLRPKEGGLKFTELPSRFLHLSNQHEFAGWGSITKIELDQEDHSAGQKRLENFARERILGQFTASALAGNAVLGSVFYALPAVVAVSSVYSPISLFVATLILFLWRPVMEELASALPISGAPYTYLLNVSTKTFALIGAALLLLDFASTSVVSAATAASYLAGEVSLPFPSFVVTILVLVIFVLISLTGVRESARLALVVLTFHVATMAALIIASCVHWGRIGNDQLKENWFAGQAPSASAIARQLFNGFCLGMLGLTGFECTPSYIARIKPGKFPLVLRNLHIPAIILNTSIMILVMAIIPLETILNGANILSVLAQSSAGRWLRLWIVVDAIIVLCGGVLTGILSACELFAQLACDRVIPAIFLNSLPLTGSPYVSVFSFMGFCGILYASAGAQLSIISKMFSLVWLTVMALFPLSLLLLHYNRGRLRRESKTRLSVIVAALVVVPVVFAGNVAVDPTTAAYFAAYFLGIMFIFSATQNKIHLLRWVYWVYDQNPFLHTSSITKTWGQKLISFMAILKRQPVCILVKSDEIHHLFHMILYVQKNERTACLKIVHFTELEKGVPSELEANAKILDEAFPEITIDLVLVRNSFEPKNVAALAHRLQIPTSLMFMTCPGSGFRYSVADFGTRIITL